MSSFWDRWARFYDLASQTNRNVNAAAAARGGELAPVVLEVISGRLPEGVAVLEKLV